MLGACLIGLVLCKFGYMGPVYGYMAGETAPLAKDAVNYMGESTQPGMRAAAKAVTEGIIEGRQAQERRPDERGPAANAT
jgi:hypothetical protein